jgi:hypothetical protein
VSGYGQVASFARPGQAPLAVRSQKIARLRQSGRTGAQGHAEAGGQALTAHGSKESTEGGSAFVLLPKGSRNPNL